MLVAHRAGRGVCWLAQGWSLSLGLAGGLFSLILPPSHADTDKSICGLLGCFSIHVLGFSEQKGPAGSQQYLKFIHYNLPRENERERDTGCPTTEDSGRRWLHWYVKNLHRGCLLWEASLVPRKTWDDKSHMARKVFQ